MAKATKPKWDFAEDYEIGMKTYELTSKYRKFLEPRLPSGLIDGLKEDLDKLGSVGKEDFTKLARVKGFSGSQDEAVNQGLNWCSRIREAVKRGRAKEEVKKAAGVGMKFSRKSVYSVTAAMNAIIDAYEKYMESFRECGVLPEDITSGKRILGALQSADEAQEREKAKKKETTSERNVLRVRIEEAVDRIIGAANVAFMNKPEILKLFSDLPPARQGKKKTEEKSEK